MAEKKLNNRLNIAKAGKKDEFYTQITDIEKELGNYRQHFKDKVVFCNCDDPEESNFWRYFSLNFEHLGLKKLISTHYHDEKNTYKLEITKDINGDGKVNQLDTVKTKLTQNGDFRSLECVEILEEADIVVTNPPFSLFREYVAQLMDYDKKFLIIGSQNAITYKETFQLIKENKIWTGVDNGGTKWFQVPDDYEIKTESRKKVVDGVKYFSMGSIYWFTNLDITKRHEDITLFRIYAGNEENYPKYDGFDAINVDKVADIPLDYEGMMGVPITFIDKYNPEQFEICGLDRYIDGNPTPGKRFTIGGKEKYARVVIRNKQA
ncbi:modification methylase [Vibrio harveyi]|uniref:adenine-specific methyltransferase EcoRI family protein n=1 Tax=Vibrio harveyi TaxID=669 RepID=UPI0005395C75|nr:adenine-specific methyltransferase EcoRI family protein [Vibrio harveyi]AIV07044.1 modification methylase [Vibrio harveyi]